MTQSTTLLSPGQTSQMTSKIKNAPVTIHVLPYCFYPAPHPQFNPTLIIPSRRSWHTWRIRCPRWQFPKVWLADVCWHTIQEHRMIGIDLKVGIRAQGSPENLEASAEGYKNPFLIVCVVFLVQFSSYCIFLFVI